MATIIDIANEAGVSFKTVSRVLNGEAGVREPTREKVLSIATELNYQPNSSARNLRSKGQPTIVMLGENPSRSFVEAMRLGATSGCQKAGYALKVEPLTDKTIIKDILSGTDIVGAVLAPPLANSEWILEYLTGRDIPYVRICAEKISDAGHKIGVDDRAAACDMTRYLIGLGHDHIGLIKGHSEYDVSRQRELGYRDAMAHAGLDVNESHIIDGDFSYVSGLMAAESLLTRADKPSAIFASNDDMAAATLAVAYKYGISVPDELSVAGFDDSSISVVVYPGLTTIRQAIHSMTEKAVKILSQKNIHRDGELEDITFEHELVERASTAAFR